MSPLDLELKTYAETLPSLLAHIGKQVVIKGTDVIGMYDTYEDALKTGYERFKMEPFLVKKIAPAEQVTYFTRSFGDARRPVTPVMRAAF